MKYLKKISQAETLNQKDSIEMMNAIMKGELSSEEICGILSILNYRGVSSEELCGFALSVVENCEIDFSVEGSFLDMCGTGGDGKSTFNISTAASLLLGAMGVPVAKHGNRAVSSKCGSADVLQELKIDIQPDTQKLKQSLVQNNFGFLYAPLFHASFKHVAPIRKKMAQRTVFNILGPLVNPLKPDYQVIGVFDKTYIPKMLEALRLLGRKSALVVSSQSGMDEFSVCEKNEYGLLMNGEISYHICNPVLLDIPKYSEDDLGGGEAPENAQIIRDVFSGKQGAALDIVALNAGAGLFVSERAGSLLKGFQLAKEFLLKGKVLDYLGELK